MAKEKCVRILPLIICIVYRQLAITRSQDMNESLIWTFNTQSTTIIGMVFGDPHQYNTNGSLASIRSLSDINVPFYPQAVAVNYMQKNLYFSDPLYGQIVQATDFVTGSQVVLTSLTAVPCSSQVTGLAFDWVSNNLYWADSHPSFRRIGVVSLTNTLQWKPIIDTDLTAPQHVAVYPQNNYLFWSDNGDGFSPKIERSDLIGNNRLQIVTTGLTSPGPLSLDFKGLRLFWLDTNTHYLSSVNFDGTNVKTWHAGFFDTLSCFTLFQDFVVFVDESSASLKFTNLSQPDSLLDTGTITAHNSSAWGGCYDMTAFLPDDQPNALSACNNNNDGCSQICISAGCQCSFGYTLHSNGMCQNDYVTDNYLIVTDSYQKNLFQMDLQKGNISAILSSGSVPLVGTNFTATAVDPGSQTVYWTNLASRSILKSTFGGSMQQIFVGGSGTAQFSGLALDIAAGSLYYTDSGNGRIARISVAAANGANNILIEQYGTQPKAIVLDTVNRKMYWTECGAIPSINLANMDTGLSRQVIVNSGLTYPLAMAIDFIGQVIYWGDAILSQIGTCKLDGSGQRVLVSQTNAYYSAMALGPEYLYITDLNQRSIHTMSLQNYAISPLQPFSFTKLNGIAFYSSAFQNVAVSMTTPIQGTVSMTTPIQESSSQTTATTNIIIAVVVGCVAAVVIIIVVIIVVVVVKKKKVPTATLR